MPLATSCVREAESSVTPDVVARRVRDLLLAFPAVAVEGVQWKVLVQKYEEHHGASLDWESAGHASALAAARSMLQGSLRVLSAEDVNDPIVGVQDTVALEPHPGLLGCWPSLYCALCRIVLQSATLEQAPDPSGVDPTEVTASLLLAQLRPRLQAQWHSQFDESTMGYRSDDGTFRRLKKMKHMLHTLFRLREQRQAWQKSKGLDGSAVDDAIAPELKVMPSQRHHDMLLCCTAPSDWLERQAGPCLSEEPRSGDHVDQPASEEPPEVPEEMSSLEEPPLEHVTPMSAEFHDMREESMLELAVEVERLRAENRKLRARNLFLEEHCSFSIPEGTLRLPEAEAGAGMSPPSSPGRRARSSADADDAPRSADYFDNPFEPPPQKMSFLMQDGAPSRQSRHSSSDFGGSTDVGGSALASGFSEWHSGCTSANISGATTPATAMRSPFARPGCAYVPVWVPFMNAAQSGFDVSIIPSGIVRDKCAQLERPI